MRKISFVFLAVLALVCGCSENRGTDLVTTQPTTLTTTALYTVASGEVPIYYTDAQLDIMYESASTLQQQTSEYATNYVKEGDAGYRVVYRGDTKAVIFVYDWEGERVAQSFWGLSPLAKTAYDVIAIGDPFSRVQDLDPNGNYEVVEHSERHCTSHGRVSIHFTIDGYMVLIKYDQAFCVEYIEVDML